MTKEKSCYNCKHLTDGMTCDKFKLDTPNGYAAKRAENCEEYKEEYDSSN